MRLTGYQTADEFLAKAQSFLEANEALNNLMLGILFRLRAHPEGIEAPPYLVTVEDEGGLALAGMITPPFNIVLYGDRAETDAFCEAVARDLSANKQTLPGVFGPSALSKSFAEVWASVGGRLCRDGMRQRTFELREVVYFGSAAGRPRWAVEDDLALVRQWHSDFTREALGEESELQADKAARRHIDAGTLYLWEDKGQPVSMAAKTRETTHGATVSLVYTPPEFRGRGFATACVAHLSQHLLDSGYQFCTLFTDLANPISNSIYQKIGYKPVGDFDEYKFA